MNGSREELVLKIGIHDGPCLAVVPNDRQDYFGTTVTIAARVQVLADSRAILATGSVVADPQASTLLKPAAPPQPGKAAHCAASPTRSRSTRSRDPRLTRARSRTIFCTRGVPRWATYRTLSFVRT
jgi:class 3 adenylate cyclase